MLIPNRYKEPRSGRLYKPTGKDVPFHASIDEQAHWTLAGLIGENYGDVGATMAEIYHEVLGPKGLTLDDTKALVEGAIKDGYLK